MPQFDSKRSTVINEYLEMISKDGKPWAYIAEIRKDGDPYYHASRVDGVSCDCPTIVEAKAKLFADQPT